ncbi:hypothetical protein AMECASPLE_018715 [Ameca splendens]|uniref:Uncharacterized protein n=1 Tax=Ameca splendens TaxID=208324 RepID=A0ABV0ZZR1_9TELE
MMVSVIQSKYLPVHGRKSAACSDDKIRHSTSSDYSVKVQCKSKCCTSDCCEEDSPILKSHSGLALKYDCSGNKNLVGFCDSDWSGDHDDHHSTTGNIFLLS